jgi:hypothetical protein
MRNGGKKRRGRPELPTGDRRVKNFTFRGTSELHDQIRAAARESNCSVSQEIEVRLLASFGQHSELREQALDEPIDGILQLIREAMDVAGNAAASLATLSNKSTHWVDNSYAFDQAVQAAVTMLDRFRPAGEPHLPTILEGSIEGEVGPVVAEAAKNYGRWFANGIIEELMRGEPRTSGTAGRLARLQRGLTPSMLERLKTRQAPEHILFTAGYRKLEPHK